MPAHTHYLWFETRRPQEILDITDQVAAQLEASGIQEGYALVAAMHITASVFVNDHESGLWQDILHWLEHTIAPWDPARYRHNETGEDNAAAHLRSLTVGHEVIVPVTAGRLDLGPWQRIFYGEWTAAAASGWSSRSWASAEPLAAAAAPPLASRRSPDARANPERPVPALTARKCSKMKSGRGARRSG